MCTARIGCAIRAFLIQVWPLSGALQSVCGHRADYGIRRPIKTAQNAAVRAGEENVIVRVECGTVKNTGHKAAIWWIAVQCGLQEACLVAAGTVALRRRPLSPRYSVRATHRKTSVFAGRLRGPVSTGNSRINRVLGAPKAVAEGVPLILFGPRAILCDRAIKCF